MHRLFPASSLVHMNISKRLTMNINGNRKVKRLESWGEAAETN